MEESLKDVMEKTIGESVQKSVEPFMRALLKSIKLVKDEAASIGAELETHSRESSGRMNELLNLLKSIYEHIQRLEEVQSGRELQPSMISPLSKQEDLETIIEGKVKSVLEPTEKVMQKILDQQITLTNTIEKMIETLKGIEKGILELKSSTSRSLGLLPLGEEHEEAEESAPADASKGALFSRLEEAVKALSEETETIRGTEEEGILETEEAREEAAPSFEQVKVEGQGLQSQPGAIGGAAPSFEQTPRWTPTATEEETIDSLQERIAEIDREVTDLTFDRMRGILSEEEYQEKKAELMRKREELKKRVEELAFRM